MDLRAQAEEFMIQSSNRRKNPVRANTIRTYRSLLENHIYPSLGSKPLRQVGNAAMKTFVADISSTLAPTTVSQAVALVKAVMASAVDAEGNQKYPVTWNADFIDAPVIRKTDLKAPVIGVEGLQEALGRAQGLEKALYSLLAGTGLRIGEALALSTHPVSGSYWDREKAVIHVSSTMIHSDRQIQGCPKTEAGVREVDVHPALNSFMASLVEANGDLCFRGLIYQTLRLHLEGNGFKGGFHAFRRFRVTHLETENVPRPLVKFWVGHSDSDITDRYVKIGKNLEFRRRECERAGLGFTLPEAL